MRNTSDAERCSMKANILSLSGNYFIFDFSSFRGRIPDSENF